jgi:hypothetical protein
MISKVRVVSSNYDYDAYIAEQEREFWRNLEANEDADNAQRFWEENGFEATEPPDTGEIRR